MLTSPSAHCAWWTTGGQADTRPWLRAMGHQQICTVDSIADQRNPPPFSSNPASSRGAAHQLAQGVQAQRDLAAQVSQRGLVIAQVGHLLMCWVATSFYIIGLYSNRAMNSLFFRQLLLHPPPLSLHCSIPEPL